MPSNLRCKTALWLIPGILLVAVISGCDIRPTTMGEQHYIMVVADSLFWDQVKEDVEAAFETILYTPHEEKNFYIKRIGINQLNDFKTQMNIFLLGTTENQNEMDKYLEKQLPEEFIDGVDNGKFFYLFQKDLYARDQIGLIMMAPTVADFKERFNLLKNEIYDQFEQSYYQRLSASTYDHGSNEKLEEFLVNHFGWKVKIQFDYFIATYDTDDRYVWLRRIQPDRWLSIWEMPADSALLQQDSLFNIRNRMAKKYYSGDIVVSDETYVVQDKFQGKPVTKIVGTWMNPDIFVGGPFRTYIVADSTKNIFYFLDLAVQAPGKLKKPFLDQLEVMANSFQVVETKTE